jgi:hypothetical protein
MWQMVQGRVNTVLPKADADTDGGMRTSDVRSAASPASRPMPIVQPVPAAAELICCQTGEWF